MGSIPGAQGGGGPLEPALTNGHRPPPIRDGLRKNGRVFWHPAVYSCKTPVLGPILRSKRAKMQQKVRRMKDERSTDFGFEQVPWKDKARRVRGVFDSVAGNYDLMNDLMSAGAHRLWKRFTLSLTNLRPGQRALDVAGGTGDLAAGTVRTHDRRATGAAA